MINQHAYGDGLVPIRQNPRRHIDIMGFTYLQLVIWSWKEDFSIAKDTEETIQTRNTPRTQPSTMPSLTIGNTLVCKAAHKMKENPTSGRKPGH